MILLLGDFNAKHEQWDPSSTGNAAGHAMASPYQHIRSFSGTFNASEPSDGQAKPDQRPVYAYVKYDTKYVK